MKKAIILPLIVMLMTVLCSCSSDGSADIWIFSESFNDLSDNFQIDLSDVTAITNDDGTKEYECFINTGNEKNILLTLDSQKDGTIASLSVTAAAGDKISPLMFCDISETAAAVLTQNTDEDITAVLDSLGMSEPDKLGEAITTYHDTNVCRYCIISSREGISFIAELSKFIESTDEPLSLRESRDITSGNKIKPTNNFVSESVSE